MKASLDALVFVKQLGFHRDAPRLYFQETKKLNDYDFKPGARYDADLFDDGKGERRIELRTHPEGRRAVCKKVVGERTLSIIDLNGKALMFGFTGYERASVTVTKGLITIRPLKEA